MYLRKYKVVTPSFRFKKKISSFLSSPNILKRIKLNFFKKKIYSSHKFTKKNSFIYNISSLDYSGSCVLINWIKLAYKNSFLGFYEFYNGTISISALNYGFSYTKVVKTTGIGIFNFCNNSSDALSYFLGQKNTYVFLLNINFKFFNLLTTINKKRIAVSSGVFCLLKNKDFFKKLIFVKLPSKKKIFLDFLTVVHLGRSSNIYNKYTRYSSFSFKYSCKKKKQKTRGIAMNRFDHPNGGSSKIKKPFKNPWGIVAKKNK